jgi:hypothetical protein
MGTPPPVYTFDVDGFMQALEGQLMDNVAGYSIGLNQNGSRIKQANYGSAKVSIHPDGQRVTVALI